MRGKLLDMNNFSKYKSRIILSQAIGSIFLPDTRIINVFQLSSNLTFAHRVGKYGATKVTKQSVLFDRVFQLKMTQANFFVGTLSNRGGRHLRV